MLSSWRYLVSLRGVPHVGFFFRVVGALVVSVYSSNLALLFGLVRIVGGPASGRDVTVFRDQLVSGSHHALYFSALRGALGKALTRVIAITLRNRTMGTGGGLFFLTLVPTIIYPVYADGFRGAIDSGVFSYSIAFGGDFSRILQRVNMVYRGLLNVFQ